MTTLNPAEAARARKYESLLLARLASTGQRPVADAIGVHESTVSRLKDGPIAQFCQVLPLIGLKLVPAEMRCFSEQELEALFVLAKARLGRMASVRELEWED